jgi:hypothetical protein
MAGALNLFKTTLANVTTTATTVYTPPLGYCTVVLLAQVSNKGANTVQVSANVSRNTANVTSSTSLINNFSIPANDASSILTGRLILQFGDSLQLSASVNTSAQLVLSYLETLTD